MPELPSHIPCFTECLKISTSFWSFKLLKYSQFKNICVCSSLNLFISPKPGSLARERKRGLFNVELGCLQKNKYKLQGQKSHFAGAQSSSSSVRNLPLPGLRAAKKKKATLNRTRGSISLMGTPVSMFNCASAPFPVTISPMIEKAIPNCANLPTKSSFALVNPNRGPSQCKQNEIFR